MCIYIYIIYSFPLWCINENSRFKNRSLQTKKRNRNRHPHDAVYHSNNASCPRTTPTGNPRARCGGPGHDGGFFVKGKIKTQRGLPPFSTTNNHKKASKLCFFGSFQEAFCGGLFENVVTPSYELYQNRPSRGSFVGRVFSRTVHQWHKFPPVNQIVSPLKRYVFFKIHRS